MRISLIHGDNSILAYQKYRDLIDQSKKRGFEIIQINSLKDVINNSLFEEKIVFTLHKANKIGLVEWKWFGKNAPKYNSNLLIYWEGNAPVSITRNLPKEAKQEKFDIPKIIFSFLESFYPLNSKNALKLLTELVKNQPIELVFHMLARHIRDLYWVKVAKETMDLPEWRTGKLSNQASKFTDENLKEVINRLAEIDVITKTSDEDLKRLLDILIVEHLE